MDMRADVVIVGGGLAGSLTALRFAAAHPQMKVVLIEKSSRLGGHRTWTFFESELGNEETMNWLQTLIDRSWDSTSVRFPKLQKDVPGRFHAIRSETLHNKAKELLGDGVVLNANVTRISESHVELDNGDIYAARLVLDARGLDEKSTPSISGYQKFIGLEFELAEPHGLTGPVVVDACCPQLDGLRYFSLVPWDEKRILIEETYYSDSRVVNRERIHRSLTAYAERQNWNIVNVGREEWDVLPIPMSGDYVRQSIGGEPLPIGVRGGFFHATTGRSFSETVRIAEFLCSLDDHSTHYARQRLVKFQRPWLSRQSFYRLINRFIFFAAEPSLRYLVLQHIFSQSPELVFRFFNGRTTWSDRIRFLSGGLPVPRDRALRSLTESALQSWAAARTRDREVSGASS